MVDQLFDDFNQIYLIFIYYNFLRFDFDLEMSDIYKMLISLTSTNVENTNSNKKNDTETSSIDWEIQKVWKLHCSII